MNYKILEICEEDYGCEGVPEGQEPMDRILVIGSDMEKKWIRVSDRYLIENNLNEGDYIEI